MSKLLAHLPRPLYEDITHGRWIPVVGSGLSRNAIVDGGDPPPDWNGLASVLKAEMTDPDDASDAVDVISAYAQEHGRAALIERVARVIRLADSAPAPVHQELCRLPVDVVVTTNFDTLLEQAFKNVAKPCHAVLAEPQLGLTNPFPGPTLLKMHGDISRPDRMVLTESDFDSYLLKNPLLATVIASHFVQRSVVLIGYSLSDPDLRQILAMVRDRLGEGARAIYAIEVDASPSRIARFARRHVKVINLPKILSTPGEALGTLFRELFEAIGQEAPTRLLSKTFDGGLAIRSQENPRSCFLSASIETQPNYYEWLGPLSSRLEVPLLTFQDFVAPGESALAAVDSMLATAGCALIEQGSAWANVELGVALNRLSSNRVLIVVPRNVTVPSDIAGLKYAVRPESEDEWATLAETVGNWWTEVLGPVRHVSQDLLHASIGEVMVLAGELEQVLGDLAEAPTRERSLGRLVRDAEAAVPLSTLDAKILRDFVDLRNRVAHGKAPASGWDQATYLVQRVRGLVDRLS